MGHYRALWGIIGHYRAVGFRFRSMLMAAFHPPPQKKKLREFEKRVSFRDTGSMPTASGRVKHDEGRGLLAPSQMVKVIVPRMIVPIEDC